MKDMIRIRFAGSGGQGVILGTVILAEAALQMDHNVTQGQSYGPEARGGSCKAEVIISEREILFPKVEHADFLLALTQASLDKYLPEMQPGTAVMADADINVTEVPEGVSVVKVPIIDTAANEVGNLMTTCIVALGAVNSYLGLVSSEALHKAVLNNVPKGTEKVNTYALDAGAGLIGPREAAPVA